MRELIGVCIHRPSLQRKRESKGWGVSFDKLRTNESSVYIPLSAPVSGTGQALRERGSYIPCGHYVG